MTVEFGFIGAGGIASIHLDHLADRNDASVVGVCDVDGSTAESVARAHGAESFTSHRDLYESLELDAVVVGIPPFAHADQERLAVEHGVDLFVEKPLALEAAIARENERAMEKSEILTQVGHMNRYAESVRRADELIGDRTLSLVDGRWWCGVPDTAWWRVADRSGGQVLEQATHTYDLVRYFAGDVDMVHAVGGQRVNTDVIDFPDATSASMSHENGVTSHVSATSTAVDTDLAVSLVGDGFQLELNPPSDRLVGTVDGETVEFKGSGRRYEREMDAFVESVRMRDRSLLQSPYEDARRTFETTLAVNRALDTGETQEVAR